MYYVQFSTMRAVEYTNPQLFVQRVHKWLLLREGENTYLLEHLVRRTAQSTLASDRLFTVEDDSHVVAVAILLSGGCLCMSWATEEIAETLVQFMAKAGCRITSIYAPGHISGPFAEHWSALSGQEVHYERSERVYQVNRVTHAPSSTGKLEMARPNDTAALVPWMRGFISEASKETDNSSPEAMLGHLLSQRLLYLWHDPQPVAMAARITTQSHCSINFVYVPPFHRGKGHAKNITAALASHILATGHRHCFILTDTHDELTNHLYASVGGRPVADLLRCTLREKRTPVQADPAPAIEPGRLNITTSRFCTS